MANYKDKQFPLGSSDKNSLTVRYPMKAEIIRFEDEMIDASYVGYVVFNDETSIPENFEKVSSGVEWCRIYDDYDCVMVVHGETIDFYRVGDEEILIHATGGAWVDPLI